MGARAEKIKIQAALVQPGADRFNQNSNKGYVSLNAIVGAIEKAIVASQSNAQVSQIIRDDQVITIVETGDADDNIAEYPGARVVFGKQVKGNPQTMPDPHNNQAYISGVTAAKRMSLAMTFGILLDGVEAPQTHATQQQANVQPMRQNAPQTTQNKPKNPLNSEFGKLRRQMEQELDIEEAAVYQGLQAHFQVPMRSFPDFSKLNNDQKQAVLQYMRDSMAN